MDVQRLIIVSNRLPVVLSKEEGAVKLKEGSGGLVTALAPVLRDRGGIWIGWLGNDGISEDEAREALKSNYLGTGFELIPVILDKDEVHSYYQGYANEIIWPLFHDLPLLCRFDPSYWHKTQNTIAKFAQTVKLATGPNDCIWIHDYHLMTLAQELRKLGMQQRLDFFLHIPFPPLDIYLKLPWRFQILRALLEFDLIGFQTVRDLRNFTQCVRLLLPTTHVSVMKGGFAKITIEDRTVSAAVFPISINYNDFNSLARSEEVARAAWIYHEKFAQQKLIFSLDRLDFTKGIPYRLEAIRYMLKTHPEWHNKVTFVQVVIPSRTDIPTYQNLKQEIDRLVSEINSEFAADNWVPIQYLFRSLTKQELSMHYRTSEVCLITPVKDGMNLVCKEYIASNIDGNGVLVLSEFAGAAAQFQKEAILINPYDIEGLADAIFQALTMPSDVRTQRMKKMQRNVRRQDIFHWVSHFLNVAIAKELADFPVVTDYMPAS